MYLLPKRRWLPPTTHKYQLEIILITSVEFVPTTQTVCFIYTTKKNTHSRTHHNWTVWKRCDLIFFFSRMKNCFMVHQFFFILILFFAQTTTISELILLICSFIPSVSQFKRPFILENMKHFPPTDTHFNRVSRFVLCHFAGLRADVFVVVVVVVLYFFFFFWKNNATD